MSRKSCEIATGAIIIGVLISILIVSNLGIKEPNRVRIRPIEVLHIQCYVNRPANLTVEECLELFKQQDDEKERARMNLTAEDGKQTTFPMNHQTTQSEKGSGTSVFTFVRPNLTSTNQS